MADAPVAEVQERLILTLREKLAEATEKTKDQARKIADLDQRINDILGLKEQAADMPPFSIEVKAERKGEVTACVLASDWHVEEIVEPGSVNGLNEYNAQVRTARIKKLWANTLLLVNNLRHLSRVDKLVVAVMGDIITNTIHEELAETNEMSTPEAVLCALRHLIGGIDFLLKHGELKRI